MRLLVVILFLSTLASAQALLTVYSAGKSNKLPFGGGPGIQPWYGRLWVDGHKIAFIRRGQFLTLTLSEGDHYLAGETASAHESDTRTNVSIASAKRYFVRLTSKSNGAPFAPVHYFAELVTCQEAYREGAALEPVKLRRIEKPSLDYVARESYFPECAKSSDK